MESLVDSLQSVSFVDNVDKKSFSRTLVVDSISDDTPCSDVSPPQPRSFSQSFFPTWARCFETPPGRFSDSAVLVTFPLGEIFNRRNWTPPYEPFKRWRALEAPDSQEGSDRSAALCRFGGHRGGEGRALSLRKQGAEDTAVTGVEVVVPAAAAAAIRSNTQAKTQEAVTKLTPTGAPA